MDDKFYCRPRSCDDSKIYFCSRDSKSSFESPQGLNTSETREISRRKRINSTYKKQLSFPGIIAQAAEILEILSMSSLKLSSKVAMEIITEKLKAQGLPKLPPIEIIKATCMIRI